MVVEVENFFGVYLLYCINPKYKGHTYIGFTVDPNRRVKQHNQGRHAGGARRTSGKGPWEMVLIIHGFPNQIAALRFEWAWQNPQKSRRLRHLVGKRKKETRYDFRLRIVSEMLRTGPWNRLPLTIRWLKQEYQKDFDPERQPPSHMPIAYGPVKSTKVSSPSKANAADSRKADDMSEDVFALLPTSQKHSRCAVCLKRLGLEDNTLHCIVTKCKAISHTLCLAKHFLGPEKNQLIPVEGTCPKCKSPMLWGDLVRLKKGCYQHLNEDESSEEL